MEAREKQLCPDCGAGNPEDAPFCSLCGRNFQTAAPDTPECKTAARPDSPFEESPPADSNRAARLLVGCGGAGCLGLVLLALVLLFSADEKDSGSSAPNGKEKSTPSGAVSVFALKNVTLTARARDIKNTTLNIQGEDLPETLLVPAGTQLLPKTTTEAVVPRIVHRDTVIKTHPRRRSARTTLTTLNARFTGTRNAPGGTAYTLAPPKDDQSLSQALLTRLQEREITGWGLAQIGLWLVDNPELTRKELDQIRVVTTGTGYMGMGPSSSTRVAGQEAYLTLQELFDELGEPLMEYALFHELQADLEKVLAATDPQKPHRRLTNYLREGTLRRYRNPQLEANFVTFAIGPYSAEIRRRALKALCLRGIRGSTEALFDQALNPEENPRRRLIAAATLFRRKENRILPLLGALMRDPALARPLEHLYGRRIADLTPKSRARVRRKPEETHWDIWKEHMGWDGVNLKDPLNQRIREAAEALLTTAGNEGLLQESLIQLKSEHEQIRKGAIENLRKHCADRKEAFEALTAYAQTESKQPMRTRALAALSAFSASDTKSVWLEELKKEGHARDIYHLLYEAVNRKLPWAGAFVAAALEHKKAYIRSSACSLLNSKLDPKWDTAIAAAAMKESDSRTFFKMIGQLHRYKSKKALEPLLQAVDRGREREKLRTLRLLIEHHHDDTRARDLARARLKSIVNGEAEVSSGGRSLALSTLLQHDPGIGIPLAKTVIQDSTHPGRRSAVYSLCNLHPGREDLKAFLEPYTFDSIVGQAATKYLKAKPSPPKPAR